ncbi:DUF6297 family protein [Mangrovihabitans endophyticus]|uniref:Uncharacterized protein n=1 Tax=Mangrovihabitans endophyticus TaxID=1751298 RepID=A0A8J3C2T5_9ACTN|nr:DUF6297 family protein [Mangrovihabitans endophyticus]GGK99017.1 hypothetical protein GCM10012284_36810 [Mangrovihabitans endophyticus]
MTAAAPTTTVTAATVPVGPVRRWIRRRRFAYMERGEMLGSLYFAVFFVAVAAALLHRQWAAVFWPARPDASMLFDAGLAAALLGALFLAMRRLGPLALSRPAVSWLLTAPVSRRRLLLPSLLVAVVGGMLAGAAAGVALVGRAGPRTAGVVAAAAGAGALSGAAVLLTALAAQARSGAATGDDVAYLILTAGLAALVADAVTDAAPPVLWPAGRAFLVAGGALAVIVVAGFTVAVRRLGTVSDERIVESSRTAGTLADAVFGVEPSFVTEMLAKRYWAGRRLRSRPLRGPGRRGLPVLVVQDVLLAARRPRRLLALAGSSAAPLLLTHAPGWLLGVAVLLGAMAAGGVTTGTVRTDTGNPWMLRLLGLDSRQAVTQRLYVPGALAALWSAAALTLLDLTHVVPGGPWWALGLTLGPVGAVAAVRRARAGFVDSGLLPLDTPMGSVSTGPVLAAVIGVEVLLLGLPTLVHLAGGDPLDWTTVLVQAVAGAGGASAYLSLTTAVDRVELSARR